MADIFNIKNNVIFPDKMETFVSVYVYSTDNYLILTTLKQGSTFLSDRLYGGWRPHFYYSYYNNCLKYAFSESDSHPHEKITQIEKDNIITNIIKDYNDIINLKSNKKICFIIRNPYERLISSITQDTISLETFFTESNNRFDKLNKIFKKERLVPVKLEYRTLDNDKFYWLPKIQNISSWFYSAGSHLFFKYFIDEWYNMRSGISNLDYGNGHLVSKWEGIVYTFIISNIIPNNRIKIVDIDKDNLNQLIGIDNKNKPNNSNVDIIKKLFKNEFSSLNNEKYIMRFIDYDIWFYNLINNTIKQ